MRRSSARNLTRAGRLYRRRKFSQVITFLEPQVFLFRESYRYYYLLGMSCLHTGDFAGAFSYLQRALDIEERPEAMLGLGAVLLRRRQMDQALRNYLDLIDLDNRNKRALRALQWLRNLDNPEEVVEWFEDRRIRKILPPPGLYVPFPLLAGTGAILLLFILLLGFRVGSAYLSSRRTDLRPGSELVALSRSPDDLLETEGEYRYELTPTEVERIFTRVGDYFNENRDNLVRRELNRIAASNANDRIKARAALLRDYLITPDFSDFRDGFSWSEVNSDPVLHDRTYVRWKGRVANLRIDPDRIRFDLLVGYHTGQVVEGIVPVELQFAVVLENNNPVEIIGSVRADDDRSLQLRGTSIRIISQRELN